MRDERMDEILGAEEELVPSSGFVASVIERVREEAVAPPPIPFPWKRAIPGWALAAAVFGWTGVEFARRIGPGIATMKLPAVHWTASALGPVEHAGGIIAAVAVPILSWMLTRRLGR